MWVKDADNRWMNMAWMQFTQVHEDPSHPGLYLVWGYLHDDKENAFCTFFPTTTGSGTQAQADALAKKLSDMMGGVDPQEIDPVGEPA